MKIDSSGNVVRTFATSGGSDGTDSYSWNGLTNSGSAAPAGTYTLRILSADGSTLGGSAYKEMKIDGTGFDSSGQPLLMSGDKAWSLSTLLTVS